MPPEQAVQMHAAVKARGVPTALVMYAGEQHGFRSAAAIRSALEGELWFFGKALGFEAEYDAELQPIEVDNLPAAAGDGGGGGGGGGTCGASL